MAADIQKFIDDEELRAHTGLAFTSLGGSHPWATEEFVADADRMMDILCLMGALIIEGNPEVTSPQAIRRHSEDLAKRVAAYARAIREYGEQTGMPFIQHFGGTGKSYDAGTPGSLN